MKQHIVFTGGGTAGHVIPNLALIETLRADNWKIDYIGSENGVEKAMVNALNIPYHAIRTGKLRRYFSWKNLLDPFNMVWGIFQAYRILKLLKVDVVFSKGGYVAFPVVVAAWLQGIPVIAHESDMSPGLANRLSFPFVNKICLTSISAKKHFKNQKKIVITGTPIRKELFAGSKEKGLSLCGFHEKKPCLLVIGGSQGSMVLNKILRQSLPVLCEDYQIIHLCGKGKIDNQLLNMSNYYQLEYANEELPDLFAASELVLSRAGANTLYEILALEKPHILVPLSAQKSRGDQIQNAQYFKEQGISKVIVEEDLTSTALLNAIKDVEQQRGSMIAKMQALQLQSGVSKIIAVIRDEINQHDTLDR